MSGYPDLPFHEGSQITWSSMRGQTVLATVESIDLEPDLCCVTLTYPETSRTLEGKEQIRTRREIVKLDALLRELACATPGTEEHREPPVILTDWQSSTASWDAPPDWPLELQEVDYYRCNGERVLARVTSHDMQEGVCRLEYSVSRGSQDRRRSAVLRVEDLWRMQQQPGVLPLAFSELTSRLQPLQIDKVEERGVTLDQLESLLHFMEKRCTAGINGWHCSWSGAELRVPTINLYQVCDWIIKPLTKPSRCSYVEAVAGAAESQHPEWFVSHWWGEPVCDFIKCVEKHSDVRGLNCIAYWVCAYANRQHELGQDLAVDPMESSFLKAMARCDGVLLVLDAEATPFTRVWCCFEEGVLTLATRGLLQQDTEEPGRRSALQKLVARDGREGRRQPLQLDIVTICTASKEPELLTEGLAEHEKNDPCHMGWEMKSIREKSFPLDVARRCLDIDIREASASQEIDKTRILNALAGCESRSLDKAPGARAHLTHDAINQALRSLFAIAMWRRAVQDGRDISSHTSELPLAKALRDDFTRTTLQLNLAGLPLVNRDIEVLANCFTTLKELTQLTLILSGCQGLTSVAELGRGLASLQQLTQLTLDLSGCQGLTSVAELGRGLSSLQQLTQLTLDLSKCLHLKSVAEIGEGLAGLQQLMQLTFQFGQCFCLNSVAEIGEGLAGLQQLTHLSLYLSYCFKLTSVAELGKGLARLQQLTQLTLDLRWCQGLASELRCKVSCRKEFLQLLGSEFLA